MSYHLFPANRPAYIGAGIAALAVSGIVIRLFYYWFAQADRYVIFLYNHAGATPFDDRTVSRYWMSGLVTGGIVLVGYSGINWLLGRLCGLFYKKYTPPHWGLVWLLSVLPVSVGIFWITTQLNQPTLPPMLAGGCVAAMLLALGPALYLGSMTAQAGADLVWLLLVGAGLTPALLLLRAVELPGQGILSPVTAYGIAIGGTGLGLVWSIVLIRVQSRWLTGSRPGRAGQFLAAGVSISYLLLPLTHYLFASSIRYMSVAANFFARSWLLQGVVFLIVIGVAFGLERLQQHWIS